MFQILLSFAVTASAAKMSPFIVGGNEVSIKNWPFIAFVQITRKPVLSVACGGSLLSSQTVLTAAHCLDDNTEKKKKLKGTTIRVYMGHASLDKAKLTRSVLDYESHKKYSSEEVIPQFDIGIMLMSRPVKFGSKIKKVILQPKLNTKVNKKFAVAGWGYTDTDVLMAGISMRLKAVKMKTKTSELCKLLTGVICAQNKKGFPYSGDSGGPMVNVKTLQQVGIVSARVVNSGTSLFTSVAHYWNWIKKAQLKLFKRFCKKQK